MMLNLNGFFFFYNNHLAAMLIVTASGTLVLWRPRYDVDGELATPLSRAGTDSGSGGR
jgi:uncharacterized protein RhaS with RHS repeats